MRHIKGLFKELVNFDVTQGTNFFPFFEINPRILFKFTGFVFKVLSEIIIMRVCTCTCMCTMYQDIYYWFVCMLVGSSACREAAFG